MNIDAIGSLISTVGSILVCFNLPPSFVKEKDWKIGLLKIDAPDDSTWNRYLLGKVLLKCGLGLLLLGLVFQLGPVLFLLSKLGK